MIGTPRPLLGHASSGPVLTPFPNLPLLTPGGVAAGLPFRIVYDFDVVFQPDVELEACFDPESEAGAQFDTTTGATACFDPTTDGDAEFDTVTDIDVDTEGEQ